MSKNYIYCLAIIISLLHIPYTHCATRRRQKTTKPASITTTPVQPLSVTQDTSESSIQQTVSPEEQQTMVNRAGEMLLSSAGILTGVADTAGSVAIGRLASDTLRKAIYKDEKEVDIESARRTFWVSSIILLVAYLAGKGIYSAWEPGNSQ